MKDKRTTIHIAMPTKDERELLRLLTPAERLTAMLDAARRKAAKLTRGDTATDTATAGAASDDAAGSGKKDTAP